MVWRSWYKYAVITALLLTGVALVNYHRHEEAGLRAEIERVKKADSEALLQAQGALVVSEQKSKDVEARAENVEAQNAALRSEVNRLVKLNPGTRRVGALRASTGGTAAGGAPRPSPGAGANAPVQACTAPAPACLLAPGDTGEVRVGAVKLQTKEGANALVMEASAWRLKPEPATKLFGGLISSDASGVWTETPKKCPDASGPGWGAVGGGSSEQKWYLGASPPPLKFLGITFEAYAGVGVGGAQGGIIVRP